MLRCICPLLMWWTAPAPATNRRKVIVATNHIREPSTCTKEPSQACPPMSVDEGSSGLKRERSFWAVHDPPKVATEMALHVLAYNLTRVMNIIGVQPLLVAMRA